MSKSRTDVKKKRIMRLLGVKDDFFALRGIRFGQSKDIEESGINTFDMDNYDSLDFSDLEIKEKKKGVKKIDTFNIKVRRDGKGDSIEPPNGFFPSIPFAMYILGVVKAGKSTLLDNLLELYHGAFDEIVFISPTGQLDGTAVMIQETYGITHVYKSLLALKPLVKHLEKVNKGKDTMKDKIKTLIIMDDCINEITDLAKKKNSFLNQIALNRRHMGISFIMLSQYFRRCPPVFRTNFNSFVIFRMENELEKKKISEELSGFLGMERFNEIFEEATHEPRTFLSINLDSSDKKYQYTKNFNEILITDDFMSSKMDELDKLSITSLRKLARVLMVPTKGGKKKIIEGIRKKMDKMGDSMDTEDDTEEENQNEMEHSSFFDIDSDDDLDI